MNATMDMTCCRCHKHLCVVGGELTCEGCGDPNVEHPVYQQLAKEKANAPAPRPAVNLSSADFAGSDQDRMKTLEKSVAYALTRIGALEHAIAGRKK